MNKSDLLSKYIAYAESDEELSYKIRMYPEWDDASYQTCIALVMDVVNAYKETDVLPRAVMYFFVSVLPQVIGSISNPVFSNGLTEEELALLLQRKAEMVALSKRFQSGELFYK